MTLPSVVRRMTLVFGLGFAVAHVHAADWPQWRGPNRNGLSSETGLLQQWPSTGPAQVWSIATLIVLGEIGISLGPIIASAGIAGVALAFGTQSIVRDYLTGLFIVLEDQYGVGDEIDLGEAAGTVEAVSLRVIWK